MKKLMVFFLFSSTALSADPVSQKAIHDCYNGYVVMKNHFQSTINKDPYAPHQASGITLCRVLLEHDDRDPAYGWTFQSLKEVIPDIDKFRSSLESRQGLCRIGGILYLKMFHRTQIAQGLKELEKHCP